jgi:hypothetical protein
MVNEKQLNEGYTEFSSPQGGFSSFLRPIGRVGKFFSKFFTRQGQQEIINQTHPLELSVTGIPAHPLSGDTMVKKDVIKASSLTYSSGGTPALPEFEYDRKRRYQEFENMDEYPEIGAAFDIYADDCTQQNIDGSKWQIVTDSSMIREEVENLFDVIELEKFIWDISRNATKYGDCFIELVVDLNNVKMGVQRIKILDPNFIYRMEDEFGSTTGFFQEIPAKSDWTSYGTAGSNIQKTQTIPLDKGQIVHFRLHTSDPMYYPYGKSIAALARNIYRNLKIMEDAMLIYRLSRAPERRIFYIDTGSLPASKAEEYIKRQQNEFKKQKTYDRGKSEIAANHVPMAVDEDFFIAVNGKGSGTKIETLPGAQNLGDVDDVKYFRDKLLASLKVPKDYIVEKDQSPERKANLSQLDVKFARVVSRIQKSIEVGLETVAKRHLLIKGYPFMQVHKLKIKLPEPSDLSAKRQLDLDEQKARVVQAVNGLGIFPKEKIYKDYYQMNDNDIDKLKQQLKKEMKDPIFSTMGQMGMGGGMGGAGGPPGMDQPGYSDAGGPGVEGGENIQPTQKPNEEFLFNLEKLMINENLSEEAVEIIRDLRLNKNRRLLEHI